MDMSFGTIITTWTKTSLYLVVSIKIPHFDHDKVVADVQQVLIMFCKEVPYAPMLQLFDEKIQ